MLNIEGPHEAMISAKYVLSPETEVNPEIALKMILNIFNIPAKTLGKPEELSQIVDMLSSEAVKLLFHRILC